MNVNLREFADGLPGRTQFVDHAGGRQQAAAASAGRWITEAGLTWTGSHAGTYTDAPLRTHLLVGDASVERLPYHAHDHDARDSDGRVRRA